LASVIQWSSSALARLVIVASPAAAHSTVADRRTIQSNIRCMTGNFKGKV
jgi:methionine-rich copper-binding protein CopC